MTQKDENYNVKLQKYYFCNGTNFITIFDEILRNKGLIKLIFKT
jgi:hypothetical protein